MALRTALAYDLGGTKVAAGIVNERGKILAEKRVTAVFDDGKDAVLDQLASLGKELLTKYPKTRRIGMASAGPLDPEKGELLDPTNFARNGKRWGKVPIAKILKKRLKLPVGLDNDAAAAILAEHWVGAAKGKKNAMILTLGTGLGTGVIANGELVRAGRGLHPEGGHISLIADDPSAPCGCGNFGCAEAYLSGNGFARRFQAKVGIPKLGGKEIAELARGGHAKALEAFDEYGRLLGVAMHAYVALYAPEVIVLTGSFAQASDLFVEKAKDKLRQYIVHFGMELFPEVRVSQLNNQAGVIGGACVAFREK